MLRMIFEDSKESAIGKLLSRASAEAVNIDIHLCGGNGMLQKYLEDNYNIKDTYVIYVDVVPDNILTSKVFRKLKKYIRRNCGTNVYLIPIPCIEYYVLKVFLQEEFVSVRNVIDGLGYEVSESVKSIEQYYKYKLDKNVKECYHIGQFCQISDWTGIFYKESCRCYKKDEQCRDYEIKKKSQDLVNTLPVFEEMVYVENGISKTMNLKDISEKSVKAYNEVVDCYTLDKKMNQVQISQLKI